MNTIPNSKSGLDNAKWKLPSPYEWNEWMNEVQEINWSQQQNDNHFLVVFCRTSVEGRKVNDTRISVGGLDLRLSKWISIAKDK